MATRRASPFIYDTVIPAGWLVHDGKGMPVAPDTAPAVMFRYGAKTAEGARKAGDWTTSASNFWNWSGSMFDIVAYCPVSGKLDTIGDIPRSY